MKASHIRLYPRSTSLCHRFASTACCETSFACLHRTAALTRGAAAPSSTLAPAAGETTAVELSGLPDPPKMPRTSACTRDFRLNEAAAVQLLCAALPQLPPEDSAPQLLERFNKLWAERKADATGDGAVLRKTILRLVTPRFQLIALWQLLDSASNFMQPLIVSAVVRDLRIGSAGRSAPHPKAS